MILDKKNRKILYELDKDARQSLAQIGKEVGLPKNVVSYRIKRLEKEGIIKNYYIAVDASRLGYFSVRLDLSFQNTTHDTEKEVMDYFIKNPKTWWVASADPLHNSTVIIWFKSIEEFYLFWEDIKLRYGRFFLKMSYSIYAQAVHYKYEYLLDRRFKQDKPDIIGGNEAVPVDEIELKILRMLAENARTPLTEIAKRLSTTAKIVQYRLKKLIDQKVVLGFRTNIDYSKIGFENYRLDIYLNDYSKKKKIEAFITQSPLVIYINRTIGESDLEYDLHIRNIENLHKLIYSIKDTFSKAIKHYNYFIFKEVYKEQFMPLG